MTDDVPASPLLRPGIGHPGVNWSGDGALSARAEDESAPARGAAPAGVPRRAAGFFVDMLVLLGLAVVLSTFVVLFAGVDTSAPQAEVQREVEDLYPLLYILEGILQFFYNLLWNTIGWSPGKRMLGMRTVDREGNRPGFRRGLARTFGSILSGSFFGLGYVWAVWDREHRTWHDRIAKTYVVIEGTEQAT
jgi:uncharacterized RDD family membrane protein YckC